MDIFSSELLHNIVNAPLVEKVTTDANSYVVYQGFPQDGACLKCQIRRITYTKSSSSETWITEYAECSQRFDFAWADRATLTYGMYK